MLRFFSDPVAGLTVVAVILVLVAVLVTAPHIKRLLNGIEFRYKGPEIEIKPRAKGRTTK